MSDVRVIRWPRGKYNGQRIVGARVVAELDVLHWALVWPSMKYGRCLGVGPFRVWFQWEYER